MLDVQIIGTDALRIRILRMAKKDLSQALYTAIDKESKKQTTYIMEEHLTGGTTDTKLRTRSGHLKNTTFPIVPFEENGFIVGGTKFGTKYAGIHVGKKGKETTMEGNPYLTIPLEPALTPAGDMKLPKAKDYLGLFFITSKKGNLLLVQGNKKGGITPFFVLKKQIKVKTRVPPEEILAKRKPIVEATIRREIDKVINQYN